MLTHRKGQIAIVTGASRGIGRAVAIELSKMGMDLALIARNREQLGHTAALCRAHEVRAEIFALDMTQLDAIEGVVSKIVETLGCPNVLINNAGLYTLGSVEEIEPEQWFTMLDVNLRASMLFTKYTLPHIKEGGHGAVIFISSIAGKHTFGKGSGYSASKHAIQGFAGSVYEDVREAGVKVTTICPGFVNTALVADRGLHKDKMIQTEDIALTVKFVLDFPGTGCPTEIIIRPQQSPFK
ncbi:MAG: hypothetical protein CL920_07795 [Deltaproteobacteria bacterium]|nr:hypothetical protein [Deltaproteobacteria bacterium]MBU48582.1 hypothetical protein [Deltaproteobacteria bacterium]|tara:strand:- start:2002 stop:2721 length:720 start_codon:yes stop_codon:yes gene_type:complete